VAHAIRQNTRIQSSTSPLALDFIYVLINSITAVRRSLIYDVAKEFTE
jgi:hypothetical protein